MTSLYNILHCVINRKYDYCFLCHIKIEGNPVNIQDEVIIKEMDSGSIKIHDVLSSVLGYDLSSYISAFEVLCKQCTHSAVNCYKFMTMAKENFVVLDTALSNLKTCLDNTIENTADKRTLFVTLDTNFSTQQYYDKSKNNNSISNALNSFQSLITKISPKTELPNKTENIKDHSNKKRRDYFLVPIKTSEMLYDKNDRTNLKCKVCLKLYPSLSNLRNHFIRVHAPKDYKCSICRRKFGSIALLEAHKSESHCTVVCSECGKTFHNRHSLKMHEIGHYLKLVCQDCGRVYKSQTTFKKHLNLNICGQKTRASPADAKFTCDYCNKKYTQKVSLRVHIQYEHGNYKGHECKWCKKKFWAQSRLKAHIVKHTQEKKFHCNICGGKFVTKESLLYHTRTHTGEKPYKCKFCDSRFLSTSRRVDHIKRHHTDVIFQCQICNIKYTTEVCLEKHMKTHEKVVTGVEIPSEDIVHISDDEIY